MKKIDVITVIAIASLTSLFYYGPFLDNYFVWDDFMLLENFTSGRFKDVLFGFADMRLFGNLILWLNFHISGFNPVGYSLIGIIAHIANSAMLFLLIHSLSNNRMLSIFTALIFAASAVGCDAIFWKDAFLTVSGLFFYILVLYLYVEGNKRGSRAYHSLALIVFVLAMLNKEEIASIPFMIIFIEMLFFKGGVSIASMTKKALPYLIIIILYIVLSLMLSWVFNVQQEQFDRFLLFRPLHTLFSGYTSFFISPEGRLNLKAPFLYITSLLVLLYLTSTNKDRRLLLFGFGWVFITFLPQSLTSLTRYDVPYLFNSISRHLYLPSVGPAIVFSAILLSIKERFPRSVFGIATALFLSIFILANYERVNDRGRQWQEEGKTMKSFLSNFEKLQPSVPENSYVYIYNSPIGRAYIRRALRAFYGNPKIYWIDDPSKANYAYLYINGGFFYDHRSAMKMAKSIGIDDIGTVMIFYELKGWNNEKLELLDAISASAFNDAKMHYRLAQIYQDMKMLDNAETEYRSALIITPYDVETHYNLGLLYMAKKQNDKAVEEFKFVAKNTQSPLAPMAKKFVKYLSKAEAM